MWLNQPVLSNNKTVPRYPTHQLQGIVKKNNLGDIFVHVIHVEHFTILICTWKMFEYTFVYFICSLTFRLNKSFNWKRNIVKAYSKSFVHRSSGLSHILCIVIFTWIEFKSIDFFKLFFSKRVHTPASDLILISMKKIFYL